MGVCVRSERAVAAEGRSVPCALGIQGVDPPKRAGVTPGARISQGLPGTAGRAKQCGADFPNDGGRLHAPRPQGWTLPGTHPVHTGSVGVGCRGSLRTVCHRFRTGSSMHALSTASVWLHLLRSFVCPLRWLPAQRLSGACYCTSATFFGTGPCSCRVPMGCHARKKGEWDSLLLIAVAARPLLALCHVVQAPAVLGVLLVVRLACPVSCAPLS